MKKILRMILLTALTAMSLCAVAMADEVIEPAGEMNFDIGGETISVEGEAFDDVMITGGDGILEFIGCSFSGKVMNCGGEGAVVRLLDCSFGEDAEFVIDSDLEDPTLETTLARFMFFGDAVPAVTVEHDGAVIAPPGQTITMNGVEYASECAEHYLVDGSVELEAYDHAIHGEFIAVHNVCTWQGDRDDAAQVLHLAVHAHEYDADGKCVCGAAGFEGGGETPDTPVVPDEPEGGYDVILRAEGGALWAKAVAPEDADEMNCSIEFYSSASGKTFGNGGFPMGVTAVVVPEAGEETYDRVRLLNWDTEEVLLDRALEKSVHVGDEMDAPKGVTVSRAEVTEDGEIMDRYTVTGVDLTKYCYELSDDGYGGKVEDRETFTIGKDYYGDVTTMYIRLLEARENEDGFYFSCSAYATVAVNGGEPGDEPEEYSFDVRLEDNRLFGSFNVPADAPEGPVFTYVFYNQELDMFEEFEGMTSDAVLELNFMHGIYETYRVGIENEGLVKEGKLEKKIVVRTEAFAIDGVRMTASTHEGKPAIHLEGLDLDSCAYTLRVGRVDHSVSSEWVDVDPAGAEKGAILYARRTTEDEESYLQEESVGMFLRLAEGEAPDTPVVPEEPAEGYGVSLEIWDKLFIARPIIPEGTDGNQMYDIYLYSSATGNTMGNTEFYSGGGVIGYEEADTYDCYRLLRSGTGEVLAEGKLEKSVVTAFDLEVPEGVSVKRTEESATEERYTVTGIDLGKYGYELSIDGYGGTNRTEESFVIGKDYFRGRDTLYICIFSAAEEDDAYYLNRSSYSTVTVNAESGGDTPDIPPVPDTEGYDMILTEEDGLLWVRAVAPETADPDTIYTFEFYSSASGKLFGCGGRPAGAMSVAMPDAGQETYDRVRMINYDMDEVVFDRELEKVIYAENLAAPTGVTVKRTEVTEEGETLDRYTVTGVDMNKHYCELSGDGYGGLLGKSESITVHKDYYGDVTTMYVRVMDAYETEDGFHCNVSPYTTVTVNAGGDEEGGIPQVEHEISYNLIMGFPQLCFYGANYEFGVTTFDIYSTRDGGATWDLLRKGETRVETTWGLQPQSAGEINGLKVQTVKNGEVVSEWSNMDIRLTLKENTMSDAISVSLNDGEVVMKGFLPNVLVWYDFCVGGEVVLRGYNYADETGIVETRVDLESAEEVKVYTLGYMSRADENTVRYTTSSYPNVTFNGGGETPDEPAVTTVTVTVPAGAEVIFDGKTYSDGGTLTIPDVAGGTYDLQVKKSGFLTYTIKGVTVGTEEIDLGEIKLLAGDTNNDGMINIVDMGIFRQNFGKTGNGITNAYTDTNGDKMVNILDMSVFRTNFGKTAAKDCTVTYGA